MVQSKALRRMGAVFLALWFLCGVAGAEGKRILVVESYSQEYAWDKDYCDALREKLGGAHTLEFFELDTKTLPAEEHAKMGDRAWAKIEETKPDLVVLGDDAALKFLGPRLAKAEIPTVFLGINGNPRNSFEDHRLPANFTGVLERPIFKRFILLAGEMVKGAKDCLILFDTNITSEIVKEEVFKGREREQVGEITTDLRLLKTFDEWKVAVTEAGGKYDFIVTGLYQAVRDDKDQSVPADDVITWVSAHSPVPVFGFWDFSVGKDKTIGGLVLDGREQGLKAADIILQILGGKAVADVPPVTESRGKSLFSRGQLEKWQLTIPESIKEGAILVD